MLSSSSSVPQLQSVATPTRTSSVSPTKRAAPHSPIPATPSRRPFVHPKFGRINARRQELGKSGDRNLYSAVIIQGVLSLRKVPLPLHPDGSLFSPAEIGIYFTAVEPFRCACIMDAEDQFSSQYSVRWYISKVEGSFGEWFGTCCNNPSECGAFFKLSEIFEYIGSDAAVSCETVPYHVSQTVKWWLSSRAPLVSKESYNIRNTRAYKLFYQDGPIRDAAHQEFSARLELFETAYGEGPTHGPNPPIYPPTAESSIDSFATSAALSPTPDVAPGSAMASLYPNNVSGNPLLNILISAGAHGVPYSEVSEAIDSIRLVVPTSSRDTLVLSSNPILRAVAAAGDQGLALRRWQDFLQEQTLCCGRLLSYSHASEHDGLKRIHERPQQPWPTHCSADEIDASW